MRSAELKNIMTTIGASNPMLDISEMGVLATAGITIERSNIALTGILEELNKHFDAILRDANNRIPIVCDHRKMSYAEDYCHTWMIYKNCPFFVSVYYEHDYMEWRINISAYFTEKDEK